MSIKLCPLCRRPLSDPKNTVWFAYHTDLSGFAVFLDELEALRYAVENSMQVREVTQGSVHEQLWGA